MRALRAPFVVRLSGLVAAAATSIAAAGPAAAQTGLVAAYGFGEGAGSTVADASGNANHGTITGATWTTGAFGTALNFGGGALVRVPDSASLDLTTRMTLEAWVYPTAAGGGWKDVLFKSVDMYYLEGSSPGGVPAMGGTFSSGPLYGTGALPVNGWSHLAATYDGASVRLYVNGVQVASRAQTGSIQASTGELSIGGDAAFGQYWVGRIDEVRIYNRALIAAEIQADMTTPIGGSVPPPPPPPSDPGLTVRWQQPSGSAPVNEFRVYKGPAVGQGTRIYTGLPAPDGSGVYSADVQVDEIAEGIPVYVWLTAANGAGESAPSNANVYPEGCDPLVDADCDRILDAPTASPCATGQSAGCDDNCPYWPNPGQEDAGGLNSAPPDGIGNACQCGDVSGDGRITLSDAALIQRALLSPPRATLARPELCDVGGSTGCSLTDAAIIQRALLKRTVIRQNCDPALQP